MPDNANSEYIHAHKTRAHSSDVNPLIRSSVFPINNRDNNFIVGVQQDGNLSVMNPERLGKLMLTKRLIEVLKEKTINKFVKYYEVDRKTHPFSVSINAPTSQATFKLDARIDFQLQVADACAIVEHNITSMLDCVFLDLKRLVTETTSRFDVQRVNDAKLALQSNFDNFNPPAYLKFKPGVVTLEPDAEAFRTLRQIEATNIRIQEVNAQSSVNGTLAINSELIRKAAEQIEDHQVKRMLEAQRLVPNITGSTGDQTESAK